MRLLQLFRHIVTVLQLIGLVFCLLLRLFTASKFTAPECKQLEHLVRPTTKSRDTCCEAAAE